MSFTSVYLCVPDLHSSARFDLCLCSFSDDIHASTEIRNRGPNLRFPFPYRLPSHVMKCVWRESERLASDPWSCCPLLRLCTHTAAKAFNFFQHLEITRSRNSFSLQFKLQQKKNVADDTSHRMENNGRRNKMELLQSAKLRLSANKLSKY